MIFYLFLSPKEQNGVIMICYLSVPGEQGHSRAPPQLCGSPEEGGGGGQVFQRVVVVTTTTIQPRPWTHGHISCPHRHREPTNCTQGRRSVLFDLLVVQGLLAGHIALFGE